MNILYCGVKQEIKKLAEEIYSRFDYNGEYVENAELSISIKKLRRAISQNNILIVDLSFISSTTAILIALAEEHNLEIIGYYLQEPPQKTRYSDVCDAILNVDDIVDYIE